MKIKQIMVLVLALLTPCLSAYAGTLISPYPHASLVEENEMSEKDYRIAIGSVDVVNNAVRVAKELRMDVVGASYLFRVAEGYSSKDAIDFVTEQLKDRSADIIFNCSARGCGDSNSWANVIFRKSKLYGKEIDQNYIAAKFSKLPGEPIFLAYTARRGNGQVFLYLEELRDASKIVLGESAMSTGTVKLLLSVPVETSDKADFALTQTSLNDIQRLASDTNTSVWVVSSYAASGQSLTDAMQSSTRVLERFISQLETANVNTEQLKTLAVGAFSGVKLSTPGVIHIHIESNGQ